MHGYSGTAFMCLFKHVRACSLRGQGWQATALARRGCQPAAHAKTLWFGESCGVTAQPERVPGDHVSGVR